jgi:hypothetical protein
MWADGVFDPRMDKLLSAMSVGLCLAVLWWRGRRLGAARFGSAHGVLWLIAAIILPPTIYFGAAVGLWIGAAITDGNYGAQIGLVLSPPALCLLFTWLLARALTYPPAPRA